jgi:hypothetical protein
MGNYLEKHLLPSSVLAELSCIISANKLTPSPADFVRVSKSNMINEAGLE